uniref:Peroxisome biogenesis protein 2 n=1 Tax=Heterorhabditis bacteriophora TaxID=37862 RepID=A0A1I7XC29_HETBA
MESELIYRRLSAITFIDTEILVQDLIVKLNNEETVAPLIIEWSLNNTGLRDMKLLQLERGCSEELDIHVALVPTSQWPHFSATNVQLGRGRWSFVQWTGKDDQNKILTRLHSVIWEVMVDVPHLNSIMRRGLRQKIQPWHIATLPQSHQKRLVWDSAPISMDYVVQIIFLHENGAQPGWCGKQTVETVWRFGDKLKNVTQLHVSICFLKCQLFTSMGQNFIMLIDQFRTSLGYGNITLFGEGYSRSMDFIPSRDGATSKRGYVDINILGIAYIYIYIYIYICQVIGDDSRGVVIASWGAIIPRSEYTEERILAAIRVLLGVDTDLSSGWVRDPVPIADWEIDRLRLRAIVDNSMRSISAIGALKVFILLIYYIYGVIMFLFLFQALTEKITNIVIKDDVAERASEAVRLVIFGLKDKNKPDLDLISKGRRLADEALSHPSLLSLLYFPKDQKMAVYLPIMLPTLIPLLGSMLAIFKWVLNKK